MSIDEFSAAIGSAADSVETVTANIDSAKSVGESLVSQIAALGMERSSDQTEAVRQRLEAEALPLAMQLKDLLTQIQQEALALKDGGGLPRGGTSPRTAPDPSTTEAATPTPRPASVPKPTKSHGTQQKRAGIGSGPVRFSIPRKLEGKLTGNHRRQVQEYVDAANQALSDGTLSSTGRVRPSRDPRLKNAKEAAAARERARAEQAGRPYGDKVAAHLPDTTWSGTAEPPGGWGRHDAEINASLGSQSDKYPEGYRPTGFEIDATWDTVGPVEADQEDLP
ncbi:hypothetical protein [Glycomyces salinus]|uniref:hypothetical protein n=1 Tax=Glycomyces salinus TaxID=980294 RepID=UPI0018EC3AC9|nr:hypothetical protein [Glycomyces salinus]